MQLVAFILYNVNNRIETWGTWGDEGGGVNEGTQEKLSE